MTRVHTFYHVWFKWIDPIPLLPTVFTAAFRPHEWVDSFVPKEITTYNPDQGFLLHHLAALFLFVAIVHAGVLRVTNEVAVWRVTNAGILLVDITMLISFYLSLKQQHRLSFGAIRGVDWGNFGFTLLNAAVRITFLAGAGVSKETKRKKI